MEAWLGWVAAALLAGAWWWKSRRREKDWRHFARLLEELAAGRAPAGFIFQDAHFAQFTHALDKLASEQRRVREQFHHDAFNLRTILASMEEAVMVVDAHHVLRLANPSFLKLFELSVPPLGQTVLHALRETAFERMIATALKTGVAQTGEVAMNAGRQARHFAVHAVPIREESGQPGAVMIVRDISRLRQLEEVRREFVANVSHELRTPLSIFHGYLENLIDEPAMPRKAQAEIFEVLRKHSLRLNALLEDLLILARLESRHEELELGPLALGEILHGVGGDWSEKMRRQQLTLTIDAPADLPPVPADRLRLEQVLHNLLENAVKYTAPGGRVVLRAAAEDSAVVVRVEDTGSGIPPADLPHIFERFYRADKARTREHGGTGLGLSIVKHIVQLHGGTVAAESVYGHGTAIVLRLPRADS